MTVKQMQCLLVYLGKQIDIDGIRGRQTEQALAEIKAEYGVDESGLVGIIAGTVVKLSKPLEVTKETTWWDSIKYFCRGEFRCRGNGCCSGFPAEPAEKLVRMLDDVREHFGVPGEVSSGVRCDKHNAEVGGVATSRHRYGWAADVCFKGIPPAQVVAYVSKHPSCAYTYAIQSGGKDTGYVHMDVVI